MNGIEATEFLERLRWGSASSCPRCASADVYRMRSRDGLSREQRLRWRCRRCERQFSVLIGTPLENSRATPPAWVRVMMFVSEREAMPAATEIAASLGGSYKSAVYLAARLPLAMPIFGFQPRPRRPHFTNNWTTARLPLCDACGERMANVSGSRCPRCRAAAHFKVFDGCYAAERGEWSHPSKEETWWKIAKAQLSATNRLLVRLRSQRDAALSEPAATSPA